VLFGLGSVIPYYLGCTVLFVMERAVMNLGCTALYRIIWAVKYYAVLVGLYSISCNGTGRSNCGEPCVVVNVAFVIFL
jgi:hypothetical protein